MPVRDGRHVTYAQLQAERDAAGDPTGDQPGPGERTDLTTDTKAQKRNRKNAEAAVKDATGEDVEISAKHVGTKVLSEDAVAEAEEDSRAHVGDTVFRDTADQIAGREDPIGTPAGAPIGALPEGVEVEAADDEDAGKMDTPPGATTSKSVTGLNDPDEKAPAKRSRAQRKAKE